MDPRGQLKMDRDLTVAAISMECQGGLGAAVLEGMRRVARRLSREGVEVLCFPEACLTGYSVRSEEARAWSEPLSGPLVQGVREIARELGVYLLAGLMERGEGEALHVAHLALGPHGEMTVYRKTHLSPQEERVFVPGDRPGLFSLRSTTGGVALCFEAHFPEWIARLAVLGAELLFFPHASPHESPQEKAERWLRYLPARAYDNGAFAVACNQGGTNGAGLSFPAVAMILDPKGRILASQTGEREAAAVATLSAEEIARVRSRAMGFFLGRRRPELYQPEVRDRTSEVGTDQPGVDSPSDP
jgi:N-carbamoylputrescine amidase